MSIKEKLGNRIRELRNKKGLSQEKFSFDCDLDRTYIASIERGKRNVSIVNIEKIAKALDISISELFNSEFFQ
jgi:transcriptional regulator with XRE-family HTH domain